MAYAHATQIEVEHFRSEPLARSTLADPDFSPVPVSRSATPGDGHTLMGETWNSPETISHTLSLFRPANPKTGQPAEIRRFYTFGKGLNAHPGLLHGGVIACILDSSLGNVVGLGMGKEGGPIFTVQLNVSFKAPVKTPGTIMARARLLRSEGHGRKIWAEGVIEGDGGIVHGRAEGLWLKAMAAKA